MAIRVGQHHTTEYRFDRPVGLSPHVIRLRPAAHCRTPILSYALRVEPAGLHPRAIPSAVRLDAVGNRQQGLQARDAGGGLEQDPQQAHHVAGVRSATNSCSSRA